MLTLPQRARWILLLPLLCATAGCPWIGDTGALDEETGVLDDGTDPDTGIDPGTDPEPDTGCQTGVFGETPFNESCFGE